jgi:HAMP domain-containing protein
MSPRDSFVRRLRLGLGVLVGITLLGLVGILLAQGRASTALARSEAALSLLEDMKDVQIQLSAARAAEREFLLEDLRTPAFFQGMESPALERHAGALLKLEDLFAALAANPAAKGLRLGEIRGAIDSYGGSFHEIVSLYRERGYLYTGHIGKLREAVFGLRELATELAEAPQQTFSTELAELTRDESDYLRDLDNRPRFLVTERLQILREDLAKLEHSKLVELVAQVDAYEQGWKQLLEIDDRIGRSSGAGVRRSLRDAQETVVTLTTAAAGRARERFDSATRTVHTTASLARLISAGGVVLAAAFAFLLSLVLGRQLQNSLRSVASAVEAYAAGDRSARVGSLPRRDEFALLGEAFDRMAETVAETSEELEEINASLELAVKHNSPDLLDRIRKLVTDRNPQRSV